MDFRNDPRFKSIESFDQKVQFSSPTMHGDEQGWMDEAIRADWVSNDGANIDAVEKALAQSLGAKYKLHGKWVETGTLGSYNAISYNGNNVFKIEGDVDFCNKVLRKAA